MYFKCNIQGEISTLNKKNGLLDAAVKSYEVL